MSWTRRSRYLAPGFIDAHCHDDLICLREPERIEKIAQGVTTLVVGNCSFSLYPTAPRSARNLRKHFSTLLGEVSRRRSVRRLCRPTATPFMDAAWR